MSSQDELKQQAAARAVEMIESGMVVGLGSGSTANFAVKRIAARIKSGEFSLQRYRHLSDAQIQVLESLL